MQVKISSVDTTVIKQRKHEGSYQIASVSSSVGRSWLCTIKELG
jgi:hypothetical protein